MKKFLFGLLFASIPFLCANAQDISVKKGILSIDDVPALKMDGDCGIFKRLNYTFLSLSGDTLFTMKDCEVGFTDPINAPIFWHEFKTKNPSTSFKVIKNATFVNDKQVAKFFFSLSPNFIKNGAIDQELLNQFISANDFTAKLIADSTANFEFERIQLNAIQSTVLTRDINKPIKLKPVASANYSVVGIPTSKLFEIIQDSIFIGLVAVEDKWNTDGTTSPYKYYFLKTLNEPFVFNNKTHYFGLVAYAENDNIGILKNLTDKSDRTYSPGSTSTNPIMDYTKHLVTIGCYK